jgi:hypothetical protein
MLRRTILFLVTAILASAATIRLYLKDGDFQLAREYKVADDRVRYYSVERGDWEEIPLDLVDLKKTESEIKRRDESFKEEAAALAAEDKAERDTEKEVGRVPQEPGVYLVAGNELKTIPLAESKVAGGTKKRSILKVLSPIPMVSGKGTLEVDGEHSPNVVSTDRPEFYIRLTRDERFGMIRLGERKGNRVVERLTIVPVTKEIVEEQDEVQVFRKQTGDGLYKIWPMKPLEAGEYAVVEYTPALEGSLNIQVWDFGMNPGSAPAVKSK